MEQLVLTRQQRGNGLELLDVGAVVLCHHELEARAIGVQARFTRQALTGAAEEEDHCAVYRMYHRAGSVAGAKIGPFAISPSLAATSILRAVRASLGCNLAVLVRDERAHRKGGQRHHGQTGSG